jgi:hypothetical protein
MKIVTEGVKVSHQDGRGDAERAGARESEREGVREL